MSITRFLSHFFEPDERIFGRAIKPKGCTENLQAYKFDFTINLLSEKHVQQQLIDFNKQRGMYFVVNAGGHSDVDIFRFNAAFCEIDNLPMDEQHDLYTFSPMPPTIRVETRKSVHAYWPLDECITPAEFLVLQKGLIQYFKSDAGIHNPSRLMRLPFFNHLQISDSGVLEKKRVELHSEAKPRFNFAELHEAYPFEFPKPKQEKFNHFKSNGKLDEARQEVVHRIENSSKFRRVGSFGYTSGICHNGVKSDTALYVNYETGYIACFDGCDYTTIASALGVDFK